jgi:hypothetical protein
MPLDRWKYLMEHEFALLTEEEINAGWHFCPEWDGLLIGPGMAEYESFCSCHKNSK